MKELTPNQINQVHGGIIPAILAGAAIGALAKKVYLKFTQDQPAKTVDPCTKCV